MIFVNSNLAPYRGQCREEEEEKRREAKARHMHRASEPDPGEGVVLQAVATDLFLRSSHDGEGSIFHITEALEQGAIDYIKN